MNKSKMISKKQNNKQKGFTLLETLVAIFILTLSITGPVYISSLYFKNTIESRDMISVQYLAEEVLEAIKNTSETNLLNKDHPSVGLQDCIRDENNTNNKCEIKFDLENSVYEFIQCQTECNNLKFNPDSNSIIYSNNNPSENVIDSKFIREFYIEESTNNPDQLNIVVNIKWQDKGKDKIYTLNSNLYNINYNYFFGI